MIGTKPARETTVLIVDDEASVLQCLERGIRHRSRVLTASSAEEAAVLLKTHDVDIIVADYKMPGQSGLSLLVDVKESYPRVVRVLMTAFADMDLVIRALNEGEIHRFLAKPFKHLEFSSIIDDCIRLVRAGQPGSAPGQEPGSLVIGHDSAVALSTLRIVLGTSYRVLSTSNGLDVLSLLMKKNVDALILGIGLEMLDGCTVAAYLKKEKGVSFPIIFWISGLTTALVEHLQDCGADLCIDEAAPGASASLKEYLARHLQPR